MRPKKKRSKKIALANDDEYESNDNGEESDEYGSDVDHEPQ